MDIKIAVFFVDFKLSHQKLRNRFRHPLNESANQNVTISGFTVRMLKNFHPSNKNTD